MKRLVLAVIIAVLVLLGVFYFRFQTYFIENRISEELPQMIPDSQQQVLQKPTILKQGDFVDADFFHKGNGKAFIFEYPDGRRVLRFEDFEVVNGPDVYVYLSHTTAPTGDLKSLGDYFDLGLLKGNVGNQNYELPDMDLSGYNSVVLWCKKFGILFPYAVLDNPKIK